MLIADRPLAVQAVLAEESSQIQLVERGGRSSYKRTRRRQEEERKKTGINHKKQRKMTGKGQEEAWKR